MKLPNLDGSGIPDLTDLSLSVILAIALGVLTVGFAANF